MNTDKSISNALGIESTQIEIIPPESSNTAIVSVEKNNTAASVVEENDDIAEEDFKFVRNKMKELIEKGTLKLDEMGTLASELENARAFEVYGGLVEKISGLSKDLYDLHKKKKETSGIASKSDDPKVTVEKAVFVGTTAELLAALKKEKNE
jgi:hypothetical protein